MPTDRDTFSDIARYYDGIMDHVDYDRWLTVAAELATMLPEGFRHLDAACGTGTLLKMLRQAGWRSVGLDLSFAMLREGRKGARRTPMAAADLRALPVNQGVDYITCLFDSMNFLIEWADFQRALTGFYDALTPHGLLYFDVVTERMVSDYYEGQSWVEENGRFRTTWDNEYDRNKRVIRSKIRINTGAACDLDERIYSREDIERGLGDAGFQVLGVVDAHTWHRPTRKTVRLDFVACKGDARRYRKAFRDIRVELQGYVT